MFLNRKVSLLSKGKRVMADDYCVGFDGNNDYGYANSSGTVSNDNFAVSVWCYLHPDGDNKQHIVGTGHMETAQGTGGATETNGNWSVGFSETGTDGFKFEVHNYDDASNHDIITVTHPMSFDDAKGKWHHIIVMRIASTYSIMVNGELDTTDGFEVATGSSNPLLEYPYAVDGGGQIRIGCSPPTISDFFEGYISSVAIFKDIPEVLKNGRNIDEDTAKFLYNNRTLNFFDGFSWRDYLYRWWRFGDRRLPVDYGKLSERDNWDNPSDNDIYNNREIGIGNSNGDDGDSDTAKLILLSFPTRGVKVNSI